MKSRKMIGLPAAFGLLALLALCCGCGVSGGGDMIRPLPRTTGTPVTPHHHGPAGQAPAAPPATTG